MGRPANNAQPQGKPKGRTIFGLVEEQQKSGLNPLMNGTERGDL